MANIVIVDDHSVVRMALRILIEAAGHEVIGEADSGLEAVALVKKLHPQLVILDIDIPQLDGMEVLKRLMATGSVKVLIFSIMPAERFANRCIEAGASGFIGKNADMDELQNAIKAILAGYTFFPIPPASQQLSALTTSRRATIDDLSSRELVVLKKIANGYRNKEIAQQLMLSEKTISTYKARIIKKLGLKNIVDLLELAKSNHLV